METTDFKCDTCLKIFKTKYILNNHKKNTKYCLKLQNKNNDTYECKLCNKYFSSKYNLDIHTRTCYNYNLKIHEEYELKLQKQEEEYELKLQKQEEKYELKIKDLQNQIKELATLAIKKPTHTHTQNNQRYSQIINNPITEQHLKEQAEYLTIDHVLNGTNGYVQYALDYPFKDRIFCSDYSRRKIKYIDEDGNLVEDPEMIILSQKLFKAINDKNTYLINEYIKELQVKYNLLIMEPNNDMDEDESLEYCNQLSMITNELFKLKGQKKEIVEISNGNKNDTYFEFTKNICAKTLK